MIKTVDIEIWGRKFSLNIYYVCYKDEELLQEQVDSMNRLLTNQQWLTNAKNIVEEYCKVAVLEDGENQKKENIFKKRIILISKP